MQVFAANVKREETRETFRDEALPVGGGASRLSGHWPADRPSAWEGQRASARAAVAGGSSLFLHSHFDNKRPPGISRRRANEPPEEAQSGKQQAQRLGPRSPDFNLMSSSGDGSGQSGLPATALMGG
ncbi:hypothetical protein ACHAPV_000464 [Trichoderma viride]